MYYNYVVKLYHYFVAPCYAVVLQRQFNLNRLINNFNPIIVQNGGVVTRLFSYNNNKPNLYIQPANKPRKTRKPFN